VRDQLDHRLALLLVVFDHQESLHLLVDELRDARERIVQRVTRHRLLEVGDGARLQSRLAFPHPADDVHGDVARVRVVLQAIENRPTVQPRQIDVQRHRVRLVRVRDPQAGLTVQRDQPLEVLLTRHVEKNAREVDVVLDDEDHAIAGRQVVTIVVETVGTRQILLGGGQRRDIAVALIVHPPRPLLLHRSLGRQRRTRELRARRWLRLGDGLGDRGVGPPRRL
jgi:hypothetical protein